MDVFRDFLVVMTLISCLPVRAGDATVVPSADRVALLVGCTFYENLPADKHLAGPGNDVELFRTTLLANFGFREQDIVCLKEGLGDTGGQAFLPTRRNMEREFLKLAERCRAGDKVVILLAGHGSQSPVAAEDAATEPDGLDEIFLPRDAGTWDRDAGVVRNAITDNELGRWVRAIAARGARVWLIVDACHSGTMMRGIAEEKQRHLIPEQDLGVLPTEMAQARQASGEASPPAVAEPDIENSSLPAGVVALYAAQPNEVTVERPMPYASANPRQHGLLSYAVCEMLSTAANHEDRVPSYLEMLQNITRRYAEWGRTFPTPVLEGPDKEREILGEANWGQEPRMQIRGTRDSLRVTAGELHGLTKDTILGVYPEQHTHQEPDSYLRVINVRPMDSDVEPYAFAGKAPARGFSERSFCRIVQFGPSDFRLRVAVDRLDERASELPVEAVTQMNVWAQEVASSAAAPFVVVRNAARADWLLRRTSDGLCLLVSASGSRMTGETVGDRVFGPVLPGPTSNDWLLSATRRIAKAQNLKRIAALVHQQQSTRSLSVELQVLGFQPDQGFQVIDFRTGEVILRDGDRVSFKIRNSGRIPVDVTLLYIDSNYGIYCVFPREGEHNRLQPGDELLVPPSMINSETSGREHVVLIAAHGRGPTTDFGLLEQEGLSKATLRGGAARSLTSPLGELLQTAILDPGMTRSLTREESNDYLMDLLSWTVADR